MIDYSIDELIFRVNEIACSILGHKKGPWTSYTFKELERLKGKKYDWRPCMRCGRTLEGTPPNRVEQMTDQLAHVYTADLLFSTMDAVSPFFSKVK